jgi:hypothetical protein
MTTAEFLSSLNEMGIAVANEDGKLVIDAPAGVVTVQLREELARRRNELIAALGMRSEHTEDDVLTHAQRNIAGMLAGAYRRLLVGEQTDINREVTSVTNRLACPCASSVHGGDQ